MLFADLAPLGSQHTVVLLHSSGASNRQWQALQKGLASHYSVLAPDFYGHGMTPAWTGERAMTLADEAARVGALLDHVPGPLHLVGHSYGGAVALALALERPHWFRSVTVYEPVLFSLLLNYNPRSLELRATMHVAEQMRRHLSHSRFDLAAESFVDFWSGTGTWAALGASGAQRQHAVAVRMPAVLAHFDALFSLGLRLQDLRHLDVPVQLLHGSATRPVTRRIVELLAFGLPQVKARRIEGATHMGPVVAAASINPHIAQFLAAHSATPQDAPQHTSANAASWRQVA